MTENPPLAQADIDVCVCTFRRPQIAATLASIAQQSIGPARKIRVIVADNDDAPTARAAVMAVARHHSLQCAYVHAPARNISVARNACLALATAPLIAFIDDDEVASPQWLAALTDTLEKTGADVVLGPVRAVYRAECPAWMKTGDFHSSLPVWKNRKIVSGGAGNVLLKRITAQTLRFREDLGRCGGEDTAYFHTLVQDGSCIAYARDAIVTEKVPQERESFLWLLKRRFRFGQTHGLLLLETTPGFLKRAEKTVVAAGKAALCLLMALLNLLRTRPMRFWSLRGALHAGVAYRLMGNDKIEQYR